jgi:vacuolar-type H+-ATPase subunit E/Vma4
MSSSGFEKSTKRIRKRKKEKLQDIKQWIWKIYKRIRKRKRKKLEDVKQWIWKKVRKNKKKKKKEVTRYQVSN